MLKSHDKVNGLIERIKLNATSFFKLKKNLSQSHFHHKEPNHPFYRESQEI